MTSDNTQPFGVVSSPSTSSRINIIALSNQGKVLPVIGHLAYFDSTVDGITYRAIGTITDIETVNALSSGTPMEIAAAKGTARSLNNSNDIRKTQLIIQSVFSYDGKEWKQYASALPNSPATGSQVFLLSEDTVKEMLTNANYPSIGYFRGLNAPAPLRLNDFSSNSGAYHSAMVGKSGSGKSSTATFDLAAKMRHEAHAIIIVDPQGQWNNENGFLFSVKAFAESLGRPVSALRVSEDIRLPRNFETMSKIINKLNLWSKLGRMGDENKEMLSVEVTERLLNMKDADFNRTPREVLSDAFRQIAQSNSTMGRIYASDERRESLREKLCLLSGLPIKDKHGEVREIDAEEEENYENMWDAILSRFTPIHSLFSKHNLNNSARKPLSGNDGFLQEVLQVRNPENPKTPAPYVVLDMSPDVKLNIKASLDENNVQYQMKRILDDEDIKALIVLSVLEEVKKASEEAFSLSGGNLNTQIVFDEAWRYAPERSESAEIMELSKALGGYARDTRKFGIGWTYILQSPNDLRQDIWKQLTYTYSGYGLVGEDVRSLEALTDDPEQVRALYRQFIPPTSTGIYPFMLTGPASPLIFTSSPTFINVFSSIDEFILYNNKWIKEITLRRSKPMIVGQAVQVKKPVKQKLEQEVTKSYGVGKLRTKPDSQTTQNSANTQNVNKIDDGVEEFPY